MTLHARRHMFRFSSIDWPNSEPPFAPTDRPRPGGVPYPAGRTPRRRAIGRWVFAGPTHAQAGAIQLVGASPGSRSSS